MLIGNRLLVRHAVAVEQRGASVLVLDRTDAPAEMETARFDALTRVPLPRPAVFSAAGRLWVVERARADGELTARWSDTAVHAAAARAATATLRARRGAALDRVTLGLPDDPALLLSASELTWYRARAAAHDGDTTALLRLLRDLPPTGYPGRVELLLTRAGELFADPALAAGADELLEPFVAGSLDARALRTALRATASPATLDVLRDYAAVAAAGDPQVVATTLAIVDGGPLPSGARSSGPAMRTLDTRIAGLAAYRDDPAALDEDRVRAIGAVPELARRAYLAGDERRLAELPETDEAVRHYRALHAFRSTGRLDAAALRPGTRAAVSGTHELAQPFPGRRVATAEVAADPSTWRFLLPNAVDEKITLTDDLRSTYPEFARWLALCATRNSLRDGRWSEVAATGERIAARAGIPALRAEALNVAAYARWQLDQADEALALLDDALATHPLPAHAVNAALIAARQGRAALPYLADVVRLASEPRVRRGAVEHAIARWRAGDGGPGYPTPLATLVRAALTLAQDDEEFQRTLLELSLAHDRVWLRGADVAARGPAQTRTVRFYAARAAYAEEPSGDALRDVATALVAVCRLQPRPVWTGAELALLAAELGRTLDAEDRTVNPVPAIAVLVAADVLDLPTHLTLASRAGAHLATAARKRGRIVSADAERRLILEPVRQFARRRDELAAAERDALAAALATHLRAATTAIVQVVVRGHTTLVDHWRRLDRDAAPHPAVTRRKAEILDRLDRYLGRCRPYLLEMEGLPVDEPFRQEVRDILTRLSRMSARARRTLD